MVSQMMLIQHLINERDFNELLNYVTRFVFLEICYYFSDLRSTRPSLYIGICVVLWGLTSALTGVSDHIATILL